MQEPIDNEPPVDECIKCGEWTVYAELRHNSGWCNSCVNDHKLDVMESNQETGE